ncbi:MAG TPA: hypothetical protein VGP47_09410 [Parachlamydiaceae bacterium]|nr:hypothetical protein [Nitrosopumilus sp.]HEV8052701.1 hypothetical protein [Parachlamydiaceae bacterium]
MKIKIIFFLICATILKFQISASMHDETREEWKKFQNGSLVIVDEIPELNEELIWLPTTGHLKNPMFFDDEYSFVISPEYTRCLLPIIENYNADKYSFTHHKYEEPLANSFYQAPHVLVFSEAEVRALKVFGIDIKEFIKTSNNNFNFYIIELRTTLNSSNFFGWQQIAKAYTLIIEIPELDALRESLNLPKQNYQITLCSKILGALNG